MNHSSHGNAPLPETYNPQTSETKWYAFWKERGFFHHEPQADKPVFSITIPPPNITGSLHMGHALNNSILDALTRWHRMRGFVTLCLPGTDHAGIATQNVVERDLAKEGLTRQQIGREQFHQRCLQWREQYGNRIYFQLEKLGCSYDWQRVRFTMDPSYVEAIMEAFRQWYQRGLVYRGTRVVNWDVKFQSAVSDIEVLTQERKGRLTHFRYPFADGSGYLTIATTRPETMLGDSAVAANPADERYQPHFGKMLRLPLTNRLIPLIADDYARPEFGSGAVKVTPAHDLNDFECGLRHNLQQIIVIGRDGRMTEEAGAEFVGLDRYEARKKVTAAMEELGLLEKVEDYTIQTPISDRSGEVIEPLLSEQWFMDMKPLAAPAIQAVEQELIQFLPERYASICLHWLENIRDWCISRQLWWGHRIPIWWSEIPAPQGHTPPEGAADVRSFGARRFVFARNHAEAAAALGDENCQQDEDVLDTWFSSALWPQATLGWPADTPDLRCFYPTSLLSTAQEILYLWVARMIMTGLDFVHRPETETSLTQSLPLQQDKRALIPFHTVYVHATVLDAKGERMSKSKGNGIDPIDLIDRFGADATRFSLLQQAGKNQDIRYSEKRTETAAAFCNKIFNAARFVLMNLAADTACALPPAERRTLPDQWILHRLGETIQQTDAALQTCDMDDVCRAVYAFFWSDFCDWYLEMAKATLRSENAQAVADTRCMLAFVLEASMRLLHPLLPFLTEEIGQALPRGAQAAPSVAESAWPHPEEGWHNPQACASVEQLMEIVRTLRNLRAESGIAPGKWLPGAVNAQDAALHADLQSSHLQKLICDLARLQNLLLVQQQPAEGVRWVSAPVTGGTALLDIGESLNPQKEKERIAKERAELEKQIARSQGMLNNPQFVERAAPAVVEKERANLAALLEKLERLNQSA